LQHVGLEDANLLFDVGQRLASRADQFGAAPVCSQRLLERQAAAFHLLDDAFELGKGCLETVRAGRIGCPHGVLSRFGARGKGHRGGILLYRKRGEFYPRSIIAVFFRPLSAAVVSAPVPPGLVPSFDLLRRVRMSDLGRREFLSPSRTQLPVSAYFDEALYQREIETLFRNGPRY